MAEIEGFGVKLHYGTVGADPAAASTGWTAVAEVVDIAPPEVAADDIETTSHDNATHDRTYQAGLVDNGESEITCHYDKTAYAALLALVRTEKAFRIKFSDNSAVSWNGYIKGIGTEVDIEGLTTMKLTIKVSGAIVATATVA